MRLELFGGPCRARAPQRVRATRAGGAAAHVMHDSTTSTQQNRDVFALMMRADVEMDQLSLFQHCSVTGTFFRCDRHVLEG